jgi:DNA-binding NtrC family response regulator
VRAPSSRNGNTRVLLGTGDDRFLRLARFLLTRDQVEVEATKRLTKTVDLVERHHPNVVVIDATDSLADAARAVAALEAIHPHVPLLVVCDGEPPRWTTGLKVTKKWEALETLTDDVRTLADSAQAWN